MEGYSVGSHAFSYVRKNIVGAPDFAGDLSVYGKRGGRFSSTAIRRAWLSGKLRLVPDRCAVCQEAIRYDYRSLIHRKIDGKMSARFFDEWLVGLTLRFVALGYRTRRLRVRGCRVAGESVHIRVKWNVLRKSGLGGGVLT